MRLIDADALLEKIDTEREILVKDGRLVTEHIVTHYIDAFIADAPTVDAVSIDDYRSMGNTCYKLQRALYEMADHFIEDAPNLVKTSSISQDSHKIAKDEPQTERRKKIGDEVYIHGYIDEIRPGTIIIRNDGGYFGTISDEVFTIQELKHEDEENKQA